MLGYVTAARLSILATPAGVGTARSASPHLAFGLDERSQGSKYNGAGCRHFGTASAHRRLAKLGHAHRVVPAPFSAVRDEFAAVVGVVRAQPHRSALGQHLGGALKQRAPIQRHQPVTGAKLADRPQIQDSPPGRVSPSADLLTSALPEGELR